MKSTSSEFFHYLLSPEYTKTHLFKFEFSRTYYWTEFSNNIFYNNQWYLSKGIRFDAAQVSAAPDVDNINIDVDNVNKWFSNLALSERLAFSPVTIWVAALDNNLNVVGTLLIFYGYYDTHTGNQKAIQCRIADHRQKWKMATPRHISSGPCPWTFKDAASQIIGTDSQNYFCIEDHIAVSGNRPITGVDWRDFWAQTGSAGVAWGLGTEYKAGTCNYIGGETWCDQSWPRCNALGNTAYFRGCRWLPYLADKEIWWGRGKNRAKM
jgi:hypothetical protein